MIGWLRRLFGPEAAPEPQRPDCMVHDRWGNLRHIDYRYVRFTICTCRPIFVAVKEPPTEPATPPLRK